MSRSSISASGDGLKPNVLGLDEVGLDGVVELDDIIDAFLSLHLLGVPT